MPLTRSFKDTVQARARRDGAFRQALLKEGIDCLIAGDVDTGKVLLRDYINATVGFEELSGLTNKPTKSLMRMFSSQGNPQAKNLFQILGYLQKKEGVHFEVRAGR